MVSVRCFPPHSSSCRIRWSSILHSSFICTFLLPSFPPPGDTALAGKQRYAFHSKRLFPSTVGERIYTQAIARNSPITTLNGGCGSQKTLNPSLIRPHPFSTFPVRAKRFREDPEWITNLPIAFPEPPAETNALKSPPPPLNEYRDPRLKRFHLHGDLVHDDKFPARFGFEVPKRPPSKKPRYGDAWIKKLLEGPFLPAQLRAGEDISTEEPDKEKLLLYLERARGHKHDLITELAAAGMWQHTVCIVRMLLEPDFEYPADIKLQAVFEGVRYTSLEEEEDSRAATLEDPVAGIPSPAIAGRSGLWAIGDQRVKWDIERRRRGYGVVLGGLAGMVLRAGESAVNGAELGSRHTDLMPTVRQVLAYLHTLSFIPDALYSVGRHPRLYMLRSRILASLADAVWRAQEAMVAAEAETLGIVGEYKGFEVPRARYCLEVWGGGSKESSERPSGEPLEQSAGQTRQIEWGTYAEREVWLELILTIIVETGYGNIGVDVVHLIISIDSKNNTWEFIDYAALHPTEYTRLAVNNPPNEPKTGVAAQWALEGHSLAPPPITTHPLSLPDWILPAVIASVVDSTAEGRGVENMFTTILSYATVLPMRKETLLRLLRHPALIWSKNAEVMEVGAGLLWEFGDKTSGCNMYYTALTLQINRQNIPGAMRVWDQIQKTKDLVPIPNMVIGRYLMFLVRNRKLGCAWDLLKFTPDKEVEGAMLPPIILEPAYTSPILAPPLLALAVASENKALYESVSRSLMDARRKYESNARITRGTWTSLINAHLAFNDIKAAKQVLITMAECQIAPDGVVVGVLVQRELQRDLEAGYKFVEAANGVIPFKTPESTPQMVHYNPKAIKETVIEGEKPPPAAPQIWVSREAWVAVLSAAVSNSDYDRTHWALKNLHIDLEAGSNLDTTTFNILLKGVAERQGSIKAMEMCHRYHTHGQERVDGVVVGDGKSFRTVLHVAVREQLKLDDEEERDAWQQGKWWNTMWGKVPEPPKEPTSKRAKRRAEWMEAQKKAEIEARAEKRKVLKKQLDAVIEWCWNESRRSQMPIEDVEKTVRIWLKKSTKPYSDYV